MKVLSATGLRAILVIRHLPGLTGVCRRQDNRYEGRYTARLKGIAALFRRLVFNAGTKIDRRLGCLKARCRENLR